MIRMNRLRKRSPKTAHVRTLTLWFNRYIRLRDKDRKCISCGIRPVEHAGHYYSTSQCPHPSMRFHEKNVNGQCCHCNTFNEGNRQGYRTGLIRKYGEQALTELEMCRTLAKNKWTEFEYRALADHYRLKCKEIAK
jgi:hypothetical protein